MAASKTRKKLRNFLGLVKYYRDIAIRRSEILAPLIRLTSVKLRYKWADVEQQAFDKN